MSKEKGSGVTDLKKKISTLKYKLITYGIIVASLFLYVSIAFTFHIDNGKDMASTCPYSHDDIGLSFTSGGITISSLYYIVVDSIYSKDGDGIVQVYRKNLLRDSGFQSIRTIVVVVYVLIMGLLFVSGLTEIDTKDFMIKISSIMLFIWATNSSSIDFYEKIIDPAVFGTTDTIAVFLADLAQGGLVENRQLSAYIRTNHDNPFAILDGITTMMFSKVMWRKLMALYFTSIIFFFIPYIYILFMQIVSKFLYIMVVTAVSKILISFSLALFPLFMFFFLFNIGYHKAKKRTISLKKKFVSYIEAGLIKSSIQFAMNIFAISIASCFAFRFIADLVDFNGCVDVYGSADFGPFGSISWTFWSPFKDHHTISGDDSNELTLRIILDVFLLYVSNRMFMNVYKTASEISIATSIGSASGILGKPGEEMGAQMLSDFKNSTADAVLGKKVDADGKPSEDGVSRRGGLIGSLSGEGFDGKGAGTRSGKMDKLSQVLDGKMGVSELMGKGVVDTASKLLNKNDKSNSKQIDDSKIDANSVLESGGFEQFEKSNGKGVKEANKLSENQQKSGNKPNSDNFMNTGNLISKGNLKTTKNAMLKALDAAKNTSPKDRLAAVKRTLLMTDKTIKNNMSQTDFNELAEDIAQGRYGVAKNELGGDELVDMGELEFNQEMQDIYANTDTGFEVGSAEHDKAILSNLGKYTDQAVKNIANRYAAKQIAGGSLLSKQALINRKINQLKRSGVCGGSENTGKYGVNTKVAATALYMGYKKYMHDNPRDQENSNPESIQIKSSNIVPSDAPSNAPSSTISVSTNPNSIEQQNPVAKPNAYSVTNSPELPTYSPLSLPASAPKVNDGVQNVNEDNKKIEKATEKVKNLQSSSTTKNENNS